MIHSSLEQKLYLTSFQFKNTIISWHTCTFTNSRAFVCFGQKSKSKHILAHLVGHIFVEHRYIFLFFMISCAYSMVRQTFCRRMPPKLMSKTTVESSDSGSDAVEAAHEGRVPALME